MNTLVVSTPDVFSVLGPTAPNATAVQTIHGHDVTRVDVGVPGGSDLTSLSDVIGEIRVTQLSTVEDGIVILGLSEDLAGRFRGECIPFC